VEEKSLSRKKEVGRSWIDLPLAFSERERKAESPVWDSRHSTSNNDPFAVYNNEHKH